jgi:arylsulfatase A-like enzyme
MWCPGTLPAGERRTELVTNLDYAPTFLELAGVAAPAEFHGRSLWPVIKGDASAWREAFLYEYFWERSFPQTPTVLGVHTGNRKLMQYHGVWDRYEMYDIATDPQERNNLLAPYITTSEGGTLDGFIRGKRKAAPAAETFVELSGQLQVLLKETGCRPEPIWAVAP